MKDWIYERKLKTILQENRWFMTILRTVRDCDPPDWLVGGGIIRNIVWDYLHEYDTPTPLKDVDVVFFDPQDLTPERDQEIENRLMELLPGIRWEAKNQAAVHLWYEKKFGFSVPPLKSSEDAVGTWPETVTSVAVRLLSNNELKVVAPCGLKDLFRMTLRRNPRRVTTEIFYKRLQEKKIVQKWPMVRVIYEEEALAQPFCGATIS